MISKFSTDQIARWRERDRRHHFHAMTSPSKHKASGPGVFLTRAKGVYLYDSEGNRCMDAVSGLGCVNIGYGNEAVAEAASEAIRELSFQNTYFGATNRFTAALSEKLAQVLPLGYDQVYYAGSGSEANESAIKLAWHYWRLKGKPDKRMIVTRTGAYHGNTIFACSLTGLEYYHPQFGLPLETPLIDRVNAPYWWRDGGNLCPEEYGRKTAHELQDCVDRHGAERIAAFIAEPLLGAGGMVQAPPVYWEEINRICRENDILLILDEVVTGFGKTGKWFACEHYGIDADLIVMAKGLSSAYVPHSAVAIHSRMAGTLLQDEELFVHGFTNNAHPVTSAVSLANIRVIEEGGLVEYVAEELGPCLARKLAELAQHPMVGEIRSCGVMAGFELSPDPDRRAPCPAGSDLAGRFNAECVARGAVLRPVGDSTVTMVLPMITTLEQVDELFEIINPAIDAVAQQPFAD